MKYNVARTHCGKQYPVEDRMIGKRAKCKSCGEVFLVPPPDRQTSDDDAIDLSAFEEVTPAPLAPLPPPTQSLPPSSRPAPMGQPALPAPPPIQARGNSRGWAIVRRRAWWALPPVVGFRDDIKQQSALATFSFDSAAMKKNRDALRANPTTAPARP